MDSTVKEQGSGECSASASIDQIPETVIICPCCKRTAKRMIRVHKMFRVVSALSHGVFTPELREQRVLKICNACYTWFHTNVVKSGLGETCMTFLMKEPQWSRDTKEGEKGGNGNGMFTIDNLRSKLEFFVVAYLQWRTDINKDAFIFFFVRLQPTEDWVVLPSPSFEVEILCAEKCRISGKRFVSEFIPDEDEVVVTDRLGTSVHTRGSSNKIPMHRIFRPSYPYEWDREIKQKYLESQSAALKKEIERINTSKVEVDSRLKSMEVENSQLLSQLQKVALIIN